MFAAPRAERHVEYRHRYVLPSFHQRRKMEKIILKADYWQKREKREPFAFELDLEANSPISYEKLSRVLDKTDIVDKYEFAQLVFWHINVANDYAYTFTLSHDGDDYIFRLTSDNFVLHPEIMWFINDITQLNIQPSDDGKIDMVIKYKNEIWNRINSVSHFSDAD